MDIEFRRKILVVSDDPKLSNLIKINLQNVNDKLDVITVLSDDKGLELLNEDNFDVIILNYDKYNQDDLGFLEKVRKRNIDIPFILIMDYKDNNITYKAFKRKADRILLIDHDIKLTCKILSEMIKKEISRYKTKKALYNRYESDYLLNVI